ncbi:MAG: hypothetical protein ACRYF0_17990 [Janthinobacterium lividum]
MKKALLLLLFSSCQRNDEIHLAKNYYLSEIGNENETSISVPIDNDSRVSVDVVGPSVFAFGSDSNYIIAKQHPVTFPESPQKNVTNYYIIPLHNPVSDYTDLNVIGPLSQHEFLLKKRELNISDNIDFQVI